MFRYITEHTVKSYSSDLTWSDIKSCDQQCRNIGVSLHQQTSGCYIYQRTDTKYMEIGELSTDRESLNPAVMAQWLGCRTRNHKVASSSPATAMSSFGDWFTQP